MTPQEQQLLDGLIDRVRSTPLPAKDADADRRIQETLGRDPNALYILCQSVLVQTYALEQAQKQLAERAAAPQRSAPEPTFLEKIFGTRDPEPPSLAPQPRAYGTPVYGSGTPYAGPGTPAQPTYTQPVYGQPAAASYPPPQGYPAGYGGYSPGYGGSGFGMGGGGGFLQGALQTAAGVAIGELAFQSIAGLFRGFGHTAGYESDRAMGFGDVGVGDSGGYDGGGGFFSREQAAGGVDDHLSSDIEDRRGDAGTGSGFLGDGGADAGDGFFSNDGPSGDTADAFDDSGSYDDGSSFDDGGSSNDDS